jgi:predicted PolB exonuclease-like 3'-5' exonuclease
VVATGWSGQLDFLVDKNGNDQFYNVSFDLGHVQPEVVWDGVLIKESMWSFPRETSAKQQMRLCYEDIKNNVSRWDNSQITSRFEDSKQYKKFVDSILGFDSSLIEIQDSKTEEQEVLEFE